VGVRPVLDHLPHASHTGGAQQLAKLEQIVLVVTGAGRRGGDQERALACPALRARPVASSGVQAPVSASLHSGDGSRPVDPIWCG